MGLTSGLAEGAGKFSGGQLLGLGISSITPWLIFGISSIVISLSLVALRYWKPIQVTLQNNNQGVKAIANVNSKSEGKNVKSYNSFKDWLLGKKRAK
jgi:hypothetical protein